MKDLSLEGEKGEGLRPSSDSVIQMYAHCNTRQAGAEGIFVILYPSYVQSNTTDLSLNSEEKIDGLHACHRIRAIEP